MLLSVFASLLQPACADEGVPPRNLKHSNGTAMVDGIYGIPRSGKFTWTETGGSQLSEAELIDTATGAVIVSRSQAATPELSYSGLKASHWYRIRVRNYTADDDPWLSVRFNTGPMPAPVITSHPASLTVEEWQPANFSVAATGENLSYSWSLNSSPVGGNSTALSLPAGSFPVSPTISKVSVKVSNPSGSVDSFAATLTVLPRPVSITGGGLVSVTAEEGGSATFCVNYTGLAETVSWQVRGRIIISVHSGPGPACITIPDLTLENTGPVCVTVTNSRGPALSCAALTVLERPVVITEPLRDVTVTEGQPATFTVNYTGNAQTVAWSVPNMVFASTHTGPGPVSITVPNAAVENAGTVTVTATNSRGPARSTARLIVNRRPPVITNQPDSLALRSGQSAVFTVEVTGQDLSYVWSVDGVPRSAGSTLTLAPAEFHNGSSVRVTVWNSGGSVTSSTAAITVVPDAPQITLQPPDIVEEFGKPFALTASAAGEGLAWQWYCNGSPVQGGTGSRLPVCFRRSMTSRQKSAMRAAKPGRRWFLSKSYPTGNYPNRPPPIPSSASAMPAPASSSAGIKPAACRSGSCKRIRRCLPHPGSLTAALSKSP